MNEKVYNNRKLVRLIGIILIILGVLFAYFNWGTEPQETIGGILSGIGTSIFLISFALKHVENK